MSVINITFPDGNEEEFEKGVRGYDIAKFISEGLANNALAIKVDKTLKDLNTTLTKDCQIQIITFKDKEGKDILRHSTAHIMAAAVKKLYPKVKVAIGPPIENGFYYDFDDLKISLEDFPKIEAEMKKIIKEKLEYKRKVIKVEEALKLFKAEPYKLELIKDLNAAETISTYTLSDFTDLCRGPHIPHTGKIKAFKLMKLAGAYWRGDSNNKMLTRIYGTAFFDKKELKEYITMLEEAEKRDHRKIGKEMDLFSFHEEGPGFPFWHNNGLILKDELMKFWRELHKKDYEEIFSIKEERLVFLEEDLVALMSNSGFSSIEVFTYIMKGFSVENWLKNCGLSSNKQKKIFEMHVDGSDQFKKAYNLKMSNGDCHIDTKSLIVIGKK